MTKKSLKHNVFDTIKEYFLITIGLFSFVIGWSIFLLPNNMVGGGVTGFSSIIYYATGVPMAYTYFITNLILFIIGLKILGNSFGAKTLYAIILVSLLLRIMPPLIPQHFIQEFAMNNGKILCAIIGGVFAGVGIGISISQGGSTGGTDIIALIVSKYRNVSPGRLILMMDVIIILISLLFPSYNADGELLVFTEKFAIVVYGLILITVTSVSIDLYISGTKQSVQVMIFSKKYKAIADAIAFDMKRGVTVLPAKGWFTKEDGQVLMVVTRKVDLNLLLRYVKNIDPDAFLSVSSVMGVYGKGFDTIKIKSKKQKTEIS